jgi:hypothetical protein
LLWLGIPRLCWIGMERADTLGIPKLCWIGMERVDTLVSFLTLQEMFSVFPHLVWWWL